MGGTKLKEDHQDFLRSVPSPHRCFVLAETPGRLAIEEFLKKEAFKTRKRGKHSFLGRRGDSPGTV